MFLLLNVSSLFEEYYIDLTGLQMTMAANDAQVTQNLNVWRKEKKWANHGPKTSLGIRKPFRSPLSSKSSPTIIKRPFIELQDQALVAVSIDYVKIWRWFLHDFPH